MDGRAGFDRLLIMNFNEYANTLGSTIAGVDATMASGAAPDIDNLVGRIPNAVRDVSVTSAADHQALMRELERHFRYDSNTSTPYGPIEVMLHRIEAEAQPGEEIVFVLVSDGEYDNGDLFKGGAMVPRMRQAFEATRDAITARGGTLSVQYLFIDRQGGSSLRTTVKDQGVRDTLTSVFNGDPATGSKYVSSADELWEALQDIIAEVSDTDREAQGRFISYKGNTISLSTPLSISRVVIVATGPRGAVPRLQTTTFTETPTETRRISTEMSGTDGALGNPAPRGGVVEHLYFQRAVPAGDYDLTFNAPVDRDVFLLFETRAVNELSIFDSSGREIQPTASGTYRLFVGQDYEFRSQILDGENTPTPVDFATLPNTLSMNLTLTMAQGPITSSMTLDDATDTGRYAWSPQQTGDVAATSRASAGILSPRSETLRITVLDSSANVSVSAITPSAACPNCASDEINVPLDVQGGAPIGTFAVEAQAEIDGQIDFAGTKIPPGMEIRDASGATVDLDGPIDFGAGSSQQFTIWRTENATPEEIAEGMDALVILANPTGQWSGTTAQTQSKPRLEAPGLGMELVDVTQPLTPGEIDGLKTPAGELLRGQFAAQFSLVSLLTPPDPERIDELVNVSSTGAFAGLVDLKPVFPNPAATGFNALEIKPETSFWCLCWLWGANVVTGTDVRDVTVNYSYAVSGVTIQQASATVPFAYPIAFIPQGGLSCALNLLYAFLTWVFLRGLWALFTTHRFPKGSMVEINRGNAAPSFKRLDKGSGLWWRAWFAAFTGNPDQTMSIEGLRMRATHKGAIVDISKTVPPWRLERLDASFQELKETQPKKTEHRLIWSDRLDSTFDPTLSMRLKKRRGD